MGLARIISRESRWSFSLPDLLPHFRCFSLIDGEWGHICGDDDDESRVVVSTEMIQYYFECINSLPKEDKFACVNDRNNTAKKNLVYGDRTETLQMKDLETLLREADTDGGACAGLHFVPCRSGFELGAAVSARHSHTEWDWKEGVKNRLQVRDTDP